MAEKTELINKENIEVNSEAPKEAAGKARKASTQKKWEPILAVILGIAVFGIHVMHVREVYILYMTADEFGYWGSGALFAGYDWSESMRASLYYGFGYGFVLAPIMRMFANPVTMYRAAIVTNGIMMAAIYGLMIATAKKLFPQVSEGIATIVSFALCLYSSYIAQSSIAWSETFIALLVWIAIWLFAGLDKQGLWLRMAGIVIVLSLTYMVHQRMLGMVIAGAICIVLGMIEVARSKTKIKIFPIEVIILVLSVAGICAAIILKKYVKQSIYLGGGTGNDYAGVVEGFTAGGGIVSEIKHIITEVFSQFYYQLVATLLFVFTGIAAIVRDVVGEFFPRKSVNKEKNNKADLNRVTKVFIFLLFFAMLGISSISMRNPGGRIDRVFYGRYVDVATMPVVLYGLMSIAKRKPDKGDIAEHILLILTAAVSFLVVKYQVSSRELLYAPYQPACASGMFGLYSLFGGFRALLFMAVAAGGYVLCRVILLLKAEYVKWVITAVVISSFFMINGQMAFVLDTKPIQQTTSIYADKIQELASYNRTGEIVYVSDHLMGDYQCMVQMAEKDSVVVCYGPEEWDEMLSERLGDVIYLSHDVPLPHELPEGYRLVYADTRFSVYAETDETEKEVVISPISMCPGTAGDRLGNGDIISTGTEGYVAYGPYITLPAGEYTAQAHLEIDPETEAEYIGYIDVTGEGCDSSFAIEAITGEDALKGYVIKTVNFTIGDSTAYDRIEIRLYVTPGIKIKLLGITL